MQQYILPLSITPKYTAERFIIGQSNTQAWKKINHWPEASTTSRFLCLYGPKGCGKTHLKHIWAARHQALWITPETSPFEIEAPFIVLNDTSNQRNETWYFNFYNHVHEIKGHVLLSSHNPPSQWVWNLADARSRFSSIDCVPIDDISPDVYTDFLKKQFKQHGLTASGEVIQYLLTHHERSFEALIDVVQKINHILARDKKNLTRHWVKMILEESHLE